MHYAKNVATCFFKALLIIDVAQDQNFRQIDVTVHQAYRDAMALELKSGPILNGLRVPTYTRSLDAVINLVEDVLLGWIWNVSRGNTSDRAWLQPDLAQHEHGKMFSEIWFAASICSRMDRASRPPFPIRPAAHSLCWRSPPLRNHESVKRRLEIARIVVKTTYLTSESIPERPVDKCCIIFRHSSTLERAAHNLLFKMKKSWIIALIIEAALHACYVNPSAFCRYARFTDVRLRKTRHTSGAQHDTDNGLGGSRSVQPCS